MRATVEAHLGKDSEPGPPIRVYIAERAGHGEGHDGTVVVKVSDEGGGVPRAHMSRIWSYLFTTADPQVRSPTALPPSSTRPHTLPPTPSRTPLSPFSTPPPIPSTPLLCPRCWIGSWAA